MGGEGVIRRKGTPEQTPCSGVVGYLTAHSCYSSSSSPPFDFKVANMAYANLAELKTYLGLGSQATDDGLLTSCIERAQAAIDSHCHRSFEAGADSTRHYHLDRDVRGRTLYFDEDCAQITKVENAGVEISSDEYVTEPRNLAPYYGITLVTYRGAVWSFTQGPEDAVKVTGRWAYSIAPPADIVQATLRLAAYFFRQKDAQVFDVTADPRTGMMTVPQGMPRDVNLMLKPYVQMAPVGGFV